MALIQQVKDGKFVDETTGTGSTSTKSSEKDKKTNELTDFMRRDAVSGSVGTDK